MKAAAEDGRNEGAPQNNDSPRGLKKQGRAGVPEAQAREGRGLDFIRDRSVVRTSMALEENQCVPWTGGLEYLGQWGWSTWDRGVGVPGTGGLEYLGRVGVPG